VRHFAPILIVIALASCASGPPKSRFERGSDGSEADDG